MDATGALALQDIPGRLLVVGGGYVGIGLGTIYAAFGSSTHLPPPPRKGRSDTA
jgi:dihydrolipoamide dehydrogenase